MLPVFFVPPDSGWCTVGEPKLMRACCCRMIDAALLGIRNLYNFLSSQGLKKPHYWNLCARVKNQALNELVVRKKLRNNEPKLHAQKKAPLSSPVCGCWEKGEKNVLNLHSSSTQPRM